MNRYIFFTILLFFSLHNIYLNSEDWKMDQKVLLQFEEMLYSNWEGTGFNYASGSVRFLGEYKWLSDDSIFKIIHNVDASMGTAYNENDKWIIQEDKLNANSSYNNKILPGLNLNGTMDLKTQFVFKTAAVMGAFGASYIVNAISVQENPATVRWVISKDEKTRFEFGNFFKVTWKGKLDTNISMSVRLENFYEYGKVWMKESFWNAELLTSFQINKFITSHIVFNLLYDPAQSKKLQAWQKITIGLTYTI